VSKRRKPGNVLHWFTRSTTVKQCLDTLNLRIINASFSNRTRLHAAARLPQHKRSQQFSVNDRVWHPSC
jgi:hypothetical protein